MGLTPEQLKARKSGLGGSDAAAACGVDPWRTPMQLWEDKTDPDYFTPENDAMRMGTLTEPVVRQLYADATGRVVTTPSEMIRSATVPFMFAHLDGVASGTRNVQCKTARSKTGWGEYGSSDIPLNYMCQVQHEMFVAGLDVTDIPVLFGMGFEFVIYTVEADRELQDELVKREREFWEAVTSRTPPDPTNSSDALLRWPKSLPKTSSAGEDDVLVAAYLRQVKDAISALEDRKEAAEAYLKIRVADAEALAYGVDLICTWKSAKSTERFDSKRFKEEHPDLYERYLTPGAPSRRFLLKDSKWLQQMTPSIQLPSPPVALLPPVAEET
jgi:putative phage-type endonuclease